MKFRIREGDYHNTAEIDLIVGRCMETILETVPELSHNPHLAREILPSFNFESTKEMLLTSLHNPHQKLIVIEDLQNELAGHSLLLIKKDEEQHHFGEFLNHYILPEHRRMKLASHLIETAEDWIKKMGGHYARVEIHSKNFKGQSLFQKHGYRLMRSHFIHWNCYEYRKIW